MQDADRADLLANFESDKFLSHLQEKSCDTVGKNSLVFRDQFPTGYQFNFQIK